MQIEFPRSGIFPRSGGMHTRQLKRVTRGGGERGFSCPFSKIRKSARIVAQTNPWPLLKVKELIDKHGQPKTVIQKKTNLGI